MKISLTIILTILISSSCRKKNIHVPFEDLQGEYEWNYSYKGINDSYAFDVSDDQYGIRITKNGRVQIYANSELQGNYRILETRNSSSGWITIESDDKDDPIIFSVKGDTISTWVYPHDNYRNYYIRKK